MKLFQAIPEKQGILRHRGVYKQVPLYRRESVVFAKFGSGFVRLCANGGTSKPDVVWDEIETDRHLLSAGGVLNAPVWTW